MIFFEDLILIFYIQVPNTTMEGTMKKKSNLHDTVLLLFGVWPKTNYGFSISEHIYFLGVLDHACSHQPHSNTYFWVSFTPNELCNVILRINTSTHWLRYQNSTLNTNCFKCTFITTWEHHHIHVLSNIVIYSDMTSISFLKIRDFYKIC